jgi:hypothetical protein
MGSNFDLVAELDRAATAIEAAKIAAIVAIEDDAAYADMFQVEERLQKIILRSVRASAVLADMPPRQILSICWKAFPSDEEWQYTRQKIVDAVLAERATLSEQDAPSETTPPNTTGELDEFHIFELPVEESNGTIIEERVTGTLLAVHAAREALVILTAAGNVVVYDPDNLKLHLLDDPVEQLRDWLDRDGYIAAVSALGETPVVDSDL